MPSKTCGPQAWQMPSTNTRPQFLAFAKDNGFLFKPYDDFGKAEQAERRQLLLSLTKEVWSPTRLEQYRVEPR